ncbi:hypothetical protein EI94DRAFT_1697990 [Lactarius quietus]|nr:hypothetical protein EI94DRAFT_1697990 [Lactarius quietus]
MTLKYQCIIGTTQAHVPVNFEQIRRNIAASQRGNQASVVPVVDLKSGAPRQRKPTTTNGSCQSTSLQKLIPTGWAPGPAGGGVPLRLPPLSIALPEEYTAPLTHKHYEVVCNQLCQQTCQGGQDALVIVINARPTVQLLGRVQPTTIQAYYIFKSETIADVPIRIDYENLKRLLFNAFLSKWLKRYKNFTLNIEQCDLSRGAVAHQNRAVRGAKQDSNEEMSLGIACSVANPTIIVECTEPGTKSKSQVTVKPAARVRVKPRAIFAKKRTISDDISDSRAQKRTWSDNFSGSSHRLMAAPVEDIRKALSAQHEPQASAINGLPQHVTESGFRDWMQEVQPQNGFILFNAAQKQQYGAFKSMHEGKINLPYLPNDYIGDSDLSSSTILTHTLSPDEQIKELAADALSIQWASSLLQDVYDFIAFYYQSHQTTCPENIPQFRSVKSGLAVTNVASVAPEKKDVYLVEELIRSEDGPWRKYINNNSSYPRHFGDPKNRHRADFLAFCQHVQYWRTGCQAFTSDFQGCKLFSKGNVQETHREFEKEHQCNNFCKFFEVPTLYDQSQGTLSDQERRQKHIGEAGKAACLKIV